MGPAERPLPGEPGGRPPRARPGRTRSEAARQAILSATRDELASSGYDKVSLERIARVAGVGKATIYRWYASKAALVAECVLEGHLMPAVAPPLTGDVRADLTEWLTSLADLELDPEVSALLRATVAATAEEETIARRYDERVTALTRNALTDRLQVAVTDGQLAGDAAVDVLVEILISVVLLRVLTRERLTADFISDLLGVLLPPVLERLQPGGRDA